jgi:hypothetical protein
MCAAKSSRVGSFLSEMNPGMTTTAEVAAPVGHGARELVGLPAVVVGDGLAGRMRHDHRRRGDFEGVPSDLLAAVAHVHERAEVVEPLAIRSVKRRTLRQCAGC